MDQHAQNNEDAQAEPWTNVVGEDRDSSDTDSMSSISSLSDTEPSVFKVITHSGRFHSDEVMAIGILGMYLETLFPRTGLSITRTRDKAMLTEAINNPETFLVDVGLTYDANKLCFDHHQVSFTDTFSDTHDIPLSSCGLIYRHYGRQLIDAIGLQIYPDRSYDLDHVYNKVYNWLILPIDANDNGVSFVERTDLLRYNPVTLPQIIGRMNQPDVNSDEQRTYFDDACELSAQIFEDCVFRVLRDSHEFVTEEPVFLEDVRTSEFEEVLVLSKAINVGPLLRKHDPDQQFKLVIAPSSRDTWLLWTVNTHHSQFEHLVSYISQADAKELYGDSIVFIHKAGFCGEAKTKDVALGVAEESLWRHQQKAVPEPLTWTQYFRSWLPW